jgi:hypothetical protein
MFKKVNKREILWKMNSLRYTHRAELSKAELARVTSIHLLKSQQDQITALD